MRTKANDWGNLETGQILYGIDIWYRGQWHHAAEDGKPLPFKTPQERDEKRKAIRRWSQGGPVPHTPSPAATAAPARR